MNIISRAPTRIGLFGGGTDLSPFCDEYGGKVLNMAINLRHDCLLSDWPWFTMKGGKGEKMRWHIDALGYIKDSILMPHRYRFKIPERGYDKKFDLIYEIIRSYGDIGKGFMFTDKFGGLQSAGLGSSASAAVSMIGAFNRWLGIEQTKAEIAEKAWQMEINLGWVSGKQDQYASAFGGINFFEFDKKVWNAPISREIGTEFVKWCLLVYSGRTRHSAKLQEKLRKRMKAGQATEPLKKIRTLTWEGREALMGGDYEKVGYLLDKGWQLKKQSNPAVTNRRIDHFYSKARKTGALGGKVLGAGSEGHMLFIVQPKKRGKVLKAIGLQEIDFGIDWQGLEVRKI